MGGRSRTAADGTGGRWDWGRRGSIHITGPDPGNKPDIFANSFATEHDRKVITDALARTRTIIGTEPFASIVNYEQTPGPAIDEAATARFATEHGFTANHSVGTCAMRSGNGVLDGQLRVHGTRNLRVIDASVFPSMPSGNTMAPTMALAWIAADLIRNTPAGRRS